MMEYIVVIFSSIMFVTVHIASPQNNSGESCPIGFYWDDDSHQCQSCPVGYYGPNCSLPCRYPNYGEKCQQKCNCTEEYCTSDKGCVVYPNCEPGYYGKDCSTPCRHPNYGNKCQSQCDCTKTLCNHITGCQSTTGTHSLGVPVERGRNDTDSSEEQFNVVKYILIPTCANVAFSCIPMLVVFVYRRRKNGSKNKNISSDCKSYETRHGGDKPCSSRLTFFYSSLNTENVNTTESTAEHSEVDECYINGEVQMTISSVTNGDTLTTTGTYFHDSAHAQPKFWNTNTGEDIYEIMNPISGNSFPNVEHIIVQPSNSENVHVHTDDQALNIADYINEYPRI